MMSRVLIALAVLGIILSLTLAACGSPNPEGAARPAAAQTPFSTTTVAIPTSTPAAPTECGFVHFGPPGLSPANYQQLIDCFVGSFQHCHPVHFVYEFFSATDQGHNELALAGTAGNCLIQVQEHYISTAKSPPIDTNYTYTCSRLDLEDGSYVIRGCDNQFEIHFP
jgi:hypothetical protein